MTVWGQFCGSRSIPAHKTASRRGLLRENSFSAVLKPLSLKASRTAQKARYVSTNNLLQRKTSRSPNHRRCGVTIPISMAIKSCLVAIRGSGHRPRYVDRCSMPLKVRCVAKCTLRLSKPSNDVLVDVMRGIWQTLRRKSIKYHEPSPIDTSRCRRNTSRSNSSPQILPFISIVEFVVSMEWANIPLTSMPNIDRHKKDDAGALTEGLIHSDFITSYFPTHKPTTLTVSPLL